MKKLRKNLSLFDGRQVCEGGCWTSKTLMFWLYRGCQCGRELEFENNILVAKACSVGTDFFLLFSVLLLFVFCLVLFSLLGRPTGRGLWSHNHRSRYISP